MIIVWNSYSSRASGRAAKYVCCEQCSAEYGYTIFREFTGHGISLFFLDNSGAEFRAYTRAQKGLRKLLENSVDPRYCPQCNHLEESMIREAKRRYLGWMSFRNLYIALLVTPGVFLLSLLIINAMSGRGEFLVPFPIFYGAWMAIVSIMILLPFLRLVLAALYDPRRLSIEGRVMSGIYRGTLLDQWEAEQEQSEANLRECGITSFEPRIPRPSRNS